MAASEPTGVVFPVVDGRRSTTATGRAVVSDALRAADPVGAAAASRETNWRQGYLPHFRRLVEAGLPSADAARAIADAGLTSLHERMRWAAEGQDDAALADAFEPTTQFTSRTVSGSGDPERELSVPYAAERLRGDALRSRLAQWVQAGTIEPSCADAVNLVIDHPEWLDLSDQTIVVLGAAAEMGPLRSLLRWGATVVAVDLPRPQLWERLFADTAQLAGQLVVPVRDTREGTGEDTGELGADLVHDLGSVTAWLEDLPGPIVLGNYVYADGETNVRVSMAVDAMTQRLVQRKGVDQVGLAFLATPTDVFAVPGEAVAASVESYAHRRTSKVLRVPLRTISGGRLLRRNHVPNADPDAPGINDSVVLQQGPNYLLAKRLQRWRATSHRAAGGLVSLKVAPPTRTRSVVKNRALAAAYAGAHRFGIEVFDPGTANTLMAALLVHDLRTSGRTGAAVAGGEARHPWEDEAFGAAHGGLWRAAYDPRSALGLAALLGFGSAR